MGEQNSYWCRLPGDILWMIIQLVDFFDYHSISAVCKKWKIACKKFHPSSTPNDPIPWLVTRRRKDLPYITIYRPLTNKSYKIKFDLPELATTQSWCLYSKDAWLLIRIIDPAKYNQTFLLLNIFSQSKIHLPILRHANTMSYKRFSGTFSTASKYPTCVVVVAWDVIDQKTTDIYAWKIGSNTWKTYHLSWDRILIFLPTIWFCDDHLYYFHYNGVMVFDYDLNLKRSNEYSFLRDLAFNMTECNKELYAVARDHPECHKFDQSTLDWYYSNVSILIGFASKFYSTSVGFMVREKWDEVFIQVKNLKNNHGCLLIVKGKQVLVDIYDHYNQTWLDL